MLWRESLRGSEGSGALKRKPVKRVNFKSGVRWWVFSIWRVGVKYT